MKKRPFTIHVLLVMFMAMGASAFGQELLSEDFDGGLPPGWQSLEIAGNGQASSIWNWTDSGPTIQDLGVLNSTTANNGWMIFDSNENCNLATNEQEAWLISPAIEASGAAKVFLTFETFYTSFNDRPQVRVGSDLSNLPSWGVYEVFPGIQANDFGGGSPDINPQTMVIDISPAAADKDTVYVAFQFLSNVDTQNNGDPDFIGCAYAWQIDDVLVSTLDIRPPNDLEITDFYGIAPNFATPLSQIEPIGFVADIQNQGSSSQLNASLNIQIEDANEEIIFTASNPYDTVAIDALVENQVFADEFNGPSAAGVYTGTYSLVLDGVDDATPQNNTQSFNFVITDTIFSKENGPTIFTSPLDDNSYMWGNVFYVPNGEGYFARTVTFSFVNGAELVGSPINFFLFEWDGDMDGDFEANADELTLVDGAFTSYEVKGSENGSPSITIPISEFYDPLPLKNDQFYILAMQYLDETNTPLQILASDELDYGAMNVASDSLGHTRYASALAVGLNEVSDITTLSLSTIGFGYDVVPFIRMSIGSEPLLDPATATKEQELPEGTVKLFPNPVNGKLNVDIALENASNDVEVKIMNASGSTILLQRYQQIQKERLEYDLDQYPEGAYFLHLRTTDGVKTKRFMVQR